MFAELLVVCRQEGTFLICSVATEDEVALCEGSDWAVPVITNGFMVHKDTLPSVLLVV